MLSRYGIFCRAAENGSFTRTAEEIGYTQSAVSQSVKSLEQELDTALFHRKKDGLTLTADGQQYYPYIQAVYAAEQALLRKHTEMQGLEHNVIRIGCFASVSRVILPALMKKFKDRYPQAEFLLQQGNSETIPEWIASGAVDFGFINTSWICGDSRQSGSAAAASSESLQLMPLFRDEIQAILPKAHPLTAEKEVSLAQLAEYPFLMLNEGSYDSMEHFFHEQNLSPKIEYNLSDDYTILSMVSEGFGISAIYHLFLSGVGISTDLAVRPIAEHPSRTLAICFSNWKTMPKAARTFVRFIEKNIGEIADAL